MGYTLEEKLVYATEHRDMATKALEVAQRVAEEARQMGGGIPGFGGSGNQRAATKVRSASLRGDRMWNEADERFKHWDNKVKYYERTIAERDRVRFTRADVVGVKFVKTAYGSWRKVKRVNQTTVSVETGYSWVDRIDLDKITEVKK